MKLEHKEVQQQTPVLKAQKYWNQDANMSALLSPESPAFPPLMALSNPAQGSAEWKPPGANSKCLCSEALECSCCEFESQEGKSS